MSDLSQEQIERLVGLRNEVVDFVAQWQRDGYTSALAARLAALAKVLDDVPAPPAKLVNRSKRALSLEECQAMINAGMLVQVQLNRGRLTIPVGSFYEAFAALGNLAIAVSDDDSYVTFTGSKTQ